MSDDRALALLLEGRGRAFDPRLVDCFVRHWPEMTGLRDAINAEGPQIERLLA